MQVCIDSSRTIIQFGTGLAAGSGQTLVEVPDSTIASVVASLGQKITLGADNATVTAAISLQQAQATAIANNQAAFATACAIGVTVTLLDGTKIPLACSDNDIAKLSGQLNGFREKQNLLAPGASDADFSASCGTCASIYGADGSVHAITIADYRQIIVGIGQYMDQVKTLTDRLATNLEAIAAATDPSVPPTITF